LDTKRKIVPIGFSNYEVLNETVARVKVFVQYAGRNRNYSHFTREAIENALPSIFGVPVVGEYKKEIDNFGGHGGKIEITDDGVEYIETTKPYGFVPLDEALADPRWETVKDDFGNSKEYLVVNAFLWRRRYPELDVVFDKDSNQSMEILIDDGEFMDDGYFDIQKFKYDALCILGRDTEDSEKNTEPCFEDSMVVGYSLDKKDFKSEFSKMVSEIKESFAVSKDEIGSGDSIDIDNSEDSAVNGSWSDVDKGAERDKIMKASNYKSLANEMYLLVDESELDTAPSQAVKYPHHVVRGDKLVVHIDGLEAAGSRLNQVKSQDDISESDYQKAINHINKHRKELGMEDLKELTNQSEEMQLETPEQEVQEVENVVEETSEAEESFEKVEEVETAEETQVETDYKALYDEIKESYDILKEDFDKLKSENEKNVGDLDDYRAKERKEAEDAIFSKYDEPLNGNSNYDSLKENASNFELDQLEKEIALIYVKNAKVFSAKKEVKSSLVTEKKVVKETKQVEDRYGDLFEKYAKEEN